VTVKTTFTSSVREWKVCTGPISSGLSSEALGAVDGETALVGAGCADVCCTIPGNGMDGRGMLGVCPINNAGPKARMARPTNVPGLAGTLIREINFLENKLHLNLEEKLF